jgi:glucoamylase
VQLYARNHTTPLATRQILPILESFADLSNRIQRTQNPSGAFSDLSSLGEPKFHADGTPFTGSWGRPQRDGPALRALTLMQYIRAYNASHPALWTESSSNPYADLYNAALPPGSVVKADLEYVARYWRESGFDLWEEVQGLHFFTAMVQLRALREGAVLANAFADFGAARWYAGQAAALEDLVRQFWSQDKGHIVATLDSERSGLDCGVLLGSLHGSTSESAGPFPPHSDEILLSLLGLVRDQRRRFPINSVPISPHAAASSDDDLAGVGIGRYPEDVYDGYGSSPAGGNPWFLCTATVAEILYRAAAHLQSAQHLNVTARGAPFWRALLGNAVDVAAEQVHDAHSSVFNAALIRLRESGDSFLAKIRTHADAEGALSEQFDRVDGFERGARDLTWSYGAFLQAAVARREVLGQP